MPQYDNAAEEAYEGRLTSDYLVTQINGFRRTDSFLSWHERIDDFDRLYGGDFSSLFPDEGSLPKEPLVENKLKNATHDLARLASEAKGAPVFMRQKETQTAQRSAALRAAIVDTLWRQGGGPNMERKTYIDLISTGTAAIAAYMDSTSVYPIYMRLNPRSCFPEVVNGKLVSMLYTETLKERTAAYMFPDAQLDPKAAETRTVLNIIYYDNNEVVQAIATFQKSSSANSAPKKKSRDVNGASIVNRWVHNLGRVPVSFKALDSADDTFHGLFDQLGGPMMIRNKTIRLLVDYLESMAHAPFEAKNVLNATDEPGPTTIYQHDPNSDQSFMRRVAPAAPSGAVFGLLQYADAQESAEAIQPPARVGVVSQSIASGSFVASTQGTLSSVVKELQETVAMLRQELGVISMKIDETWLNEEKELWRSIGTKQTYKPSEDIAGWYNHTIQYGAAAGLNRAEADVRILQHMGAGLISHELAREQLDFVEDVTVEQNRIDRERLADAMFQRFVSDPNTPNTILGAAIVSMSKGKSLVEVVTEILPQLQKAEEERKAAEAAKAGGAPAGAPGEAMPPDQQQQSLEAGGQLGQPVQFAPSPLQQQIVRNPL